MFSINEYLQNNRQGRHVKQVVCADGFSMSVQASSRHCCLPKIDKAEHYDAVEVGFPSERVSVLQRYAAKDLSGDNTDVYGYVPVEIVNQIVNDHGGLA